MVRVGEDCEKKQRFYTCRNSGTGGEGTKRKRRYDEKEQPAGNKRKRAT